MLSCTKSSRQHDVTSRLRQQRQCVDSPRPALGGTASDEPGQMSAGLHAAETDRLHQDDTAAAAAAPAAARAFAVELDQIHFRY